MAKGIGFLGNMRGKIGNMVAYSLKNSNNKETQGFRVYQPNVANPQSDAQMAQRVKLAAANTLYRSLKRIIDRGYEGVEYGDASRKKFMSLALGRDFTGPYLYKGSIDVVPIEGVPISIGSLPSLAMDSIDYSARDFYISGLEHTENADINFSTVAEFSNSVIQFNPWLQEGDQITIVGLYEFITPFSRNVIPAIRSLYLNTGDDTSLGSLGIVIMSTQVDGNGIYFASISNVVAQGMLGGYIIVSRDGADGKTHLRSTAYPALTDRLVANYYHRNETAAVYESYRASQSTSNNDWPVDDANAPSFEPVEPITELAVTLQNGNTATITGFSIGQYTDANNTNITLVVRGTTASGNIAFVRSEGENTTILLSNNGTKTCVWSPASYGTAAAATSAVLTDEIKTFLRQQGYTLPS